MRFQYTEKKVTLPENVHKYAEKKVMKLERFFGTDADALVTFSVEKNRNNVEITVHAAGTYFRASESTSDMFASIDAAVATIERQIRKNKTRLARRLRQDAFVRTPDETSFAPEEPEEGTFELVRTKKFNMKPMTREEAIPIIKERDGKLDPLCVRDFCDFCGYTESEFWAIMDKFYNRDLFEKNECGEWQLKHPIWEENK